MDISSYLLSQDLAGLLITLAVQVILISLLGYTAILMLSKRSAPVRSLVCAGTLIALGLVLVISIGFRSFDIAWTQPTLPVLLEENRADSVLFSEPDRLSPVETITPINPSHPQLSIEKDTIHSEPATSSHFSQLAVLLIPMINFMGFVWLMGFLFQLLRFVYGVFLVKKFRDSLPSVPDASFHEMIRKVAGAFWKNRMPELYISPKIESPITIGLFHPIVIIPSKLLETLSENELKSILLHELAHIYHYDQVIGVIKRMILAVHWWNPLVYIINREHEQAREEISDNYVLRELHPKVYTQCLADLAEKVCLITNFPTAVGMAGKCFSLPERVEYILSKKRSVSMDTKIHTKTITCTICLILIFGVAGLHGKVKSEKPGDVVIEKQDDGSFIHPVSLFEEKQSVLQEKVTGFEMIEKQDQVDSRVISNAEMALQTESSDKQTMKSVSPTMVMAYAQVQTANNTEKQTKADPVRSIEKPVLSHDAENRVVLAQNESPVKVTSDVAAYISRGLSCLEKGQIEDAISDFNKAITLDPGKAVAYRNRGRAYYKLGRLDHAISDYNKAIEITPGFADAYIKRGIVYKSKGRVYKALSDFSKAIELNPEDAVVYNSRGNLYLSRRGWFYKAVSDFSKAIELNPEDAVAYHNRGGVYFQKKWFDEAISDYSKAIEIDPEYAVAYISRGSTYHFIGEYEKAVSDYGKAIELNPEDDMTRKRQEYAMAHKRWHTIPIYLSYVYRGPEPTPIPDYENMSGHMGHSGFGYIPPQAYRGSK